MDERVLVDYRADLVKRRTMAVNQLKAQVHLWLDQTPGDLTRARNVDMLATLISAAQLSPHVRQALADMTAEIAALNRHVHDLDATIRELVSPLAPARLQVTGISYIAAAVLLVEIGDITRFSSSAKLARYVGCAPNPGLLRRQAAPPPPPWRQPAPQQRPLHRSHRAEAPHSQGWRSRPAPGAPRAAGLDQLDLVQPDHRSGGRVVVGVADDADRFAGFVTGQQLLG